MTDHKEPGLERLFQLLGNEVRMEVLQTLWNEFDFERYVTESREGMSFETLREKAEIEDSGNFNYHLGELTDIFVTQSQNRYVLTPLGYNVMREIERYSTFEYITIEETEIPCSCPFCHEHLVAEYRREILSIYCSGCGGLASDGNFTFVELPSTGIQNQDITALLDKATVALFKRVHFSLYSICWRCLSTMTVEIQFCEEHDRGPTGICELCDKRYQAEVAVECKNCGTTGRGPVLEYAIISPEVGAFFNAAEHGPHTIGPWNYRLAAFEAAAKTVTVSDPNTVEVEFNLNEKNCLVSIEDSQSGIDLTSFMA